MVTDLLAARGVASVDVLDALNDAAAVDVALEVGGARLRLRFEANDPARPAFARTKSFNVSYLPDAAGSPPSPVLAALAALLRGVAAHDAGGLALEAPVRARGGRLPLLQRGERDPAEDHVWSRALFEERLARVAAAGITHRSVVLVVNEACQLDCVFCPTADRIKSLRDVPADDQLADLTLQLAAARRLGADIVDIGGNDVLRYARALALFDAARALGYRRIIAQSPGHALGDPAFAAAVAASALDDLCVPIYGRDAAEHDAITRVVGSFDRLCRALDQARALGRPAIQLHTIALASRLDRLEALIDFCQERFGLFLAVALLRPNRVGEKEHLHDAAGFDAIRPLAARRPAHFVRELPLCQLPRESALREHAARRETPWWRPSLNLWDLGLPAGSEEEQVMWSRTSSYAPACGGCELVASCPGVLNAYAERFGAAVAPVTGVNSPAPCVAT